MTRFCARFLSFEDLILHFATRPDLDIFTNNEAERTLRPVKVQAAQLRRLLAHLYRTRRLRDRPVLPVYRRQMGISDLTGPRRTSVKLEMAVAEDFDRSVSTALNLTGAGYDKKEIQSDYL